MTWTHGLAIASLVLTVVTITLQVLLSLHVLRSNKEPIAILFWIQLLVFLPGVGVIAYAMFGMELKKRRLERRRRSRKRVGPTPAQREDVGAAQVWNLVTNLHQAGPWPTQVERIHTSGAALIEDMEQTIDGARRSIWLETYILRQDDVGRRILERLKARAAQGLDVRVLYDAVGSYQLSRRFVRELARAGVRIACFSPKNPLKGRFQIQYRNHRKITVVDQETAFVGGFNIGDEYLGKGAPRGVWRDTHLRVRGQVVTALAAVFAEDWHFGTGEALPLPGGAADGVLLGAPAALLVSGAEWQVRAIHSVLLDRMFKAQDTVDLATAYFVPDPAVRFAMVDAARRGVRVRLLVPGYPHKRVARLAGQSFYDELLQAGVEVHEYRGGHFHAKVAMFDGRWSMVGSANLDARSLRLNDEVALLMDDAETTETLVGQFEADLGESVCIEPSGWSVRPRWRMAAEQLAMLLSPIL